LINEVMYDPSANEYYHEWVELYNPTNESINISGWTLTDNRYKDFLEVNRDFGNKTDIIPPYRYAIVTDHGSKIFDYYNLSNQTICLYVDDKSIGNGLGNSGDYLILKNSTNNTVDYVEWINEYPHINGTAIEKIEENYTISKIKPNKTNDSKTDYFEGIPTPGEKNILLQRGETRIDSNKKEFLISKNKKQKITFEVKNLGEFEDNITIKAKEIPSGFCVEILRKNLFLKPNKTGLVNITVKPCNSCYEGKLKIFAESEKKINKSDDIELYFKINNPDLWVKKIKIYNEEKNETNLIKQGENIRVKAFLKNLGPKNASNVIVTFYKDQIKPEKLVGNKFYESVSKYQKYPSLYIDTISFSPGTHKIIVYADEKDRIDEILETNNILSFEIKIIDTRPNIFEKKLIFTEFYYHAHPGLKNEFMKIYNPNNKSIDISDWYVSNNPNKNRLDQRKIIFPNNTIIRPFSIICIAQKANDYRFQTNELPDFEYYYDSDKNVTDMKNLEKMYFSNNKGIVTLKNPFNHTIDSIVYGNNSKKYGGWNGEPLKASDKGIILKRNIQNNIFIDTNTSSDWINRRIYRIGQTDLKTKFFNFTGSIQPFVSPDSSFITIKKYLNLANESIHLNMYELTNPYLCDEIINCLLRNVSVNILIEGGPVGGVCDTEKYLLNRIHTYGGIIRVKTSDIKNKVFSRYRFNHAKYLVIDNNTTIIESCNWAETGVPIDPSFGNREWGVVVKNSSFADYYLDVFLYDWDLSFSTIVPFIELEWYIPNNYYFDNYYYKGNYEKQFCSEVFYGNFSVKPVFSPDTSFIEIYNLLNSAEKTIYIEQLYIYKYWDKELNPFLEVLSKKAKNGVDVRVIMNYNPVYDSTNQKTNQTKNYLEKNNVKVKFIYTNWSVFTNIHNKGAIIDNKSVLVSSINWNKNSFMNNREAGIIIENKNVSSYYSSVFFYDWNLEKSNEKIFEEEVFEEENENTIYIVAIYTMTLVLIIQDWRKRKWQ